MNVSAHVSTSAAAAASCICWSECAPGIDTGSGAFFGRDFSTSRSAAATNMFTAVSAACSFVIVRNAFMTCRAWSPTRSLMMWSAASSQSRSDSVSHGSTCPAATRRPHMTCWKWCERYHSASAAA